MSESLFKDIERLRLSPETLAVGTAREILAHVPVRKPHRHEFVRVHPDPDMSLTTAVFEDREDRAVYFVAPEMRGPLLGEIKPVVLLTAMTRQGATFIWPLNLPAESGRPNDWAETGRQAAELAKQAWVRVPADMSLGAYRIYRAEGELSEPEWPEKTFADLLEIAFRSRVIDREDHPVLRRLRGLA
jgi:hypothetical protein